MPIDRRTLLAAAAASPLALPLPALAQPRKDTVVLAMTLEPPGLDPTSGAASAIGEITLYNVFETLTRINPDGSTSPLLAERWDISPDLKTLTFHLRRGVKFHNGAAFNAEAVKYSFDRAAVEKKHQQGQAHLREPHGAGGGRAHGDRRQQRKPIRTCCSCSARPRPRSWSPRVRRATACGRWARGPTSSRPGARGVRHADRVGRLPHAGHGEDPPRGVPLHLRSCRPGGGPDGGRRGRVPARGAAQRAPVQGQSALPGDRERLPRQDHPRDQQPAQAPGRCARAPGHRGSDRPQGGDPGRRGRVGRSHRQPLRPGRVRLRGHHGSQPLRPRQGPAAAGGGWREDAARAHDDAPPRPMRARAAR